MAPILCFLAIKYQLRNTLKHACFKKLPRSWDSAQKLNAIIYSVTTIYNTFWGQNVPPIRFETCITNALNFCAESQLLGSFSKQTCFNGFSELIPFLPKNIKFWSLSIKFGKLTCMNRPSPKRLSVPRKS